MSPPSHDDGPVPPADLRLHVALFSHIACRPEAELDLAQAALVIAEPEYDGLDIAAYLRQLDRLAERARPRVTGIADPGAQALALINYLHVEEGFLGNVAEYDDPRNSFLNEVLSRRLGIPITLSVVMIEVARRLGIPLRGVSFPGHFLMRVDLPQERPPRPRPEPPSSGGRARNLSEVVLIDPFDGRTLDAEDLQALLLRVTGQRRVPSTEDIQVATKRTVLLRMLNNLRNLYARREDGARLQLAQERIRVLEASREPPTTAAAASRGGDPQRMN